MRDRRRMNQLLGLGFAVLLAGFTAANYFHKDTAFSDTENRMLQQKPVFSWADLADGRFMGNFEKYQTDQFIFRREWIRLQTAADRLLGKNKSGDVYLGEGQLLEEPSKLSENVWENLGRHRRFLPETDGREMLSDAGAGCGVGTEGEASGVRAGGGSGGTAGENPKLS